MRPALLVLVTLTLSCCDSFAANRSREFCAAWTKASAGKPTYDDALAATLLALDAEHASGEWGRTLRAMFQSAPGNHVALLRGWARDAKETFSCPAFETPAGPPKHRVVLDGELASQVDALVADDGGLYVLRTARVRGYDRSALLRIDAKGPRPLAEDLPRASFNAHLLLTEEAVVIALSDSLVLVPRDGRPAKPLATGLAMPFGLARDGDHVVFASGGALRRVPLAGGEAQVVAALPRESQREVIAVAPGGYLVGGFSDGELVRVPRDGSPPKLLAARSHQVVAVGQDLYFRWGEAPPPAAPAGPTKRADLSSLAKKKDVFGTPSSAPQPPGVPPAPGTWRVSFSSDEPVRVGPWFAGRFAVASGGEVLALDAREEWPGRQRLIRWRVGEAPPTVLASPVGVATKLAADAHHVYWRDFWWGPVYAAPR